MKIKITLHHEQVEEGRPVILDEKGNVLPVEYGLKKACQQLGYTREQLALESGYQARSLEPFFTGVRPAPAEVLNVLMRRLEELD